MKREPKDVPKVPGESIVYGEIVYWITIFAAILCMVGPVIAMANVGGNTLNPHYLFENIFRGEKPESVWALSATEEPVLPARTSADAVFAPLGVRAANELLKGWPEAPDGAAVELEIEGGPRLVRRGPDEVALLAGGSEDVVTLANARSAVMTAYKAEVVTNGHFWMDSPLSGDGFTQLGLAIGCSVALWGLLAVAIGFLRKKVFLYVVLSLWVAALVFLSAAGIIESH